MKDFVLWFREVGKGDVALVGGKNSSLGEMISRTRVPVPDGFAITSNAYQHYLDYNSLVGKIRKSLKGLDKDNMAKLAAAGKKIRDDIRRGKMPEPLEGQIIDYYRKLTKGERIRVAVRSSATSEDLPDASFAGQQETFLNVTEKELIHKVKECFASLFTDRAISYREDKGFDHMKVLISVGIQKMINSESSGVMFTLNPDSGFRNVVVINSSYGLGEYVVQGKVTPDEFTVFKPTLGILEKRLGRKQRKLVWKGEANRDEIVSESEREAYSITDREVRALAKMAITIEKHYGRPMDIEWARERGRLYILQARPETVHSVKSEDVIESFVLREKGKMILSGVPIGKRIGKGHVNVITNVSDIDKFRAGEVLVTGMTDPSWEPIMKKASAIITDRGGKTCHAAIVSRELGIPCVIDTVEGTKSLKSGQKVTVDCSGNTGKIFEGLLKFEVIEERVEKIPPTRTKIMVNVGIPDEALHASKLPVDGVGLAREEFLITGYIKEHPMKFVKDGREHEFIKLLAEGVAKIASPFYPRPVIVRFSDFKTNEYAGLKGGTEFEPHEENPMIGWRGVSRYIHKGYEPAFRMECKAMKRVREEMGLKNVKLMLPFCRTLDEARRVMKIMEQEGLRRGVKGLQVYVMAEIPSNVILAHEFAKIFDGFSIGSNDLTQLTLGMDRDNSILVPEFDERNAAVKRMISMLIKTTKKDNRPVGICGEAPSNYPELVQFLVDEGISSLSVNPDVAVKTKLIVRDCEKRK